MNGFWEDELRPDETEALLQKAAHEVLRRGMSVPAILALEMHKPLANVASHAALAFSPFVTPLFGFDAVNDYTRLFANRQNIERLIQIIESGEAKPVAAPGAERVS